VGQKVKTDKLPELNKAVQEYIKPDREMYANAQAEVSAFDEAFELTV
jgi:hypothetical protein